MPAPSLPALPRGGARGSVAALGLAATLTACAAGPDAGSTTGVADSGAAIDTSGVISLLTAAAERLPFAQERRFAACPVLPVADVEKSLSAVLALPPQQQPWSGSLVQDLTAAEGSTAGGDPAVSCSGTWQQVTAGRVDFATVILLVSLDPDELEETGRTLGGGQLYTDCNTQPDSCLATWQHDHVTLSVSLDGTVPVADVFDSWVTAFIPTVLHGAAELQVNTVLPPPVTASPATPATPATTTPPPVTPTGEGCEAQLLAALANYATGAAPIDPVLAAVPAGSADAARAAAEDTRAWVTSDATAWDLATTNPPALFGSGQVIGSLCAGA